MWSLTNTPHLFFFFLTYQVNIQINGGLYEFMILFAEYEWMNGKNQVVFNNSNKKVQTSEWIQIDK